MDVQRQPLGLAGFVADAASELPAALRPVLVVLPGHTPAAELDRLLDLPHVAGVLVSAGIASCQNQDRRVGVIGDDGRWRLPGVAARTLLLPAGGRPLNVKRSLQAMRSGVRAVLMMDRSLQPTVTPLWRWVARRLLLLVRRHLEGAGSKDLAQRLAPVFRDLPQPGQVNASRPRVLLVNNSLAAGGAERQLVNTARTLAARGQDIRILCYQLGTAEYDFHRPAVGEQVPLSGLRSLVEIVGGLSPDQARELRRRMRRADFGQLAGSLPSWVIDDVVLYAANLLQGRADIVHFWQDYTNVVGGLAAVMLGVPRVVLGMRNMAPFRFAYHQPFMAPIYRLLSSLDNVVMVNNSAAGAADYATWLGIDPARIRVVRNGIEPPSAPAAAEVAGWRAVLGIPADRVVVGSVFRFWPEKDPMLWLETAARVAEARPDVVFVLIGDGPMREQMLQQAAALGIRDRLFMPGVIRDPYIQVAAMDVFLLTSTVEGTPNVLIEAQLLGRPVVTTAAGGSAETIEHGRTGWVVDRRDAGQLAAQVLDVLSDRDWREAAVTRAPAFARQHFAVDRMADETCRSYGVSPC